MKRIKTLLIFPLVVALCAIALTACGGGNNGDSGGNNGGTTTSTYTLTVNKTGQGTVTGAGNYGEGVSVTVTANPSSGYTFDGWFKGTTQLSISETYTFAMQSNNLTITARFTAIPKYTLTVSKTVGGTIGGSITNTLSLISNSVSGQFESSAGITLYAWASSGYTFNGWYQGVTLYSSSNAISFNMPAYTITLQARFVAN